MCKSTFIKESIGVDPKASTKSYNSQDSLEFDLFGSHFNLGKGKDISSSDALDYFLSMPDEELMRIMREEDEAVADDISSRSSSDITLPSCHTSSDEGDLENDILCSIFFGSVVPVEKKETLRLNLDSGAFYFPDSLYLDMPPENGAPTSLPLPVKRVENMDAKKSNKRKRNSVSSSDSTTASLAPSDSVALTRKKNREREKNRRETMKEILTQCAAFLPLEKGKPCAIKKRILNGCHSLLLELPTININLEKSKRDADAALKKQSFMDKCVLDILCQKREWISNAVPEAC